ncbi:hypothetical protein H1D32_21390 [Anaerobacillus sp. CMMVII]|uniref:hypothetical protein n=1 Tax=Anaerobacillus sp. CMMVII TaxID=2755588 RepID=UPI0021B723D6|nr:hypothetical protein [Anaerobacillus sp. CMMVII]MCT8140014.1 hypothetical protein [Anaerobacillus sp. CMMVII]
MKVKSGKLIIACLILFFGFGISSIHASGDSGQFLKTWYNQLFQVVVEDVAANADEKSQQELAKLIEENEQLILNSQKQLDDVTNELSTSIVNNISALTTDYVDQIEEAKQNIINHEITSDLQQYVDQKKEQIDREIAELILQIVEEEN